MVVLALAMLAIPPEFILQQRTARADWYATPGPKVNVEKCERFLERTEKKFGVTVPHFTYLFVRDSEAVQKYGGATNASGNANPDTHVVVSSEQCSKHEIIHLAIFQFGFPHLVFQEGLASMEAEDFNWYDRWLARRRLRKLRFHYDEIEATLNGEHEQPAVWRDCYMVSDGWMRFLINRYGFARMVLFLRAHGDDTATAFEHAFGLKPEAALDEWLYGYDPPRK